MDIALTPAQHSALVRYVAASRCRGKSAWQRMRAVIPTRDQDAVDAIILRGKAGFATMDEAAAFRVIDAADWLVWANRE